MHYPESPKVSGWISQFNPLFQNITDEMNQRLTKNYYQLTHEEVMGQLEHVESEHKRFLNILVFLGSKNASEVFII